MERFYEAGRGRVTFKEAELRFSDAIMRHEKVGKFISNDSF